MKWTESKLAKLICASSAMDAREKLSGNSHLGYRGSHRNLMLGADAELNNSFFDSGEPDLRGTTADRRS